MSSKIRIIGEFGEDVLDKVQAFVETLPGVQYVSLLVNGTETLPDTAPPVIDPTAPDAPVPPDVPAAAPEQPASDTPAAPEAPAAPPVDTPAAAPTEPAPAQ